MKEARIEHRLLTGIMCGFVALGLAGCGDPGQPNVSPEVPEAGESVTPDVPETAPEGQTEDEPEPSDDVSLEIKSWEEIQALVGESQGKIVVVDLWATYCAPCLVELPNLVKLHQEHSDQVKCISVSLDFQGFEDEPVESYVDSVTKTLKAKKANCTNILCSTDSDTIYSEKIRQGSIPVVFVYDTTGKLVGEFPNPQDPAEFTYQEDVLPLVMKLLEQG